MQKGYVFKKDRTWYLRYRDNVLIDGKMQRRQKCAMLARASDQYRRKSDLADLVAEKLALMRQADRCPRASESFVSYVENVYLPFVARTMKPSTCACYLDFWGRYIRPRVQKYALRDFTLAIVSRLLEDIATVHKLNVGTISKVRSILSGIFSYAMAKGDFPGRSKHDNPVLGVRIPEQAALPKQTVAASREDVKAILAFTGVRPGEARGLRWEEWDRTREQIAVRRSVWHAIEGTPKTKRSERFVTVTEELRTILLALWNSQECPISGLILARSNGERVNLDNMAKRTIVPALNLCAVCKKRETEEHQGHTFRRNESLPQWHGWYALRRFHGTQVREQAGSSEVMSKALGNSRDVADRHYLKSTGVLPDVRKAVNDAFRGLTDAQSEYN